MVMIWWVRIDSDRPSSVCNYESNRKEREKKINNLTKILVTKKKKSDQWNFSSNGKKSPTKRNIWNYCRKMNLENQQKCHRTHSFQQFFLCSSLGFFCQSLSRLCVTKCIFILTHTETDQTESNWKCNCYLTYRKVEVACAQSVYYLIMEKIYIYKKNITK